MNKKKSEDVLLTTCPKCHEPIEIDVSELLNSIVGVFKFNAEQRRKQLDDLGKLLRSQGYTEEASNKLQELLKP